MTSVDYNERQFRVYGRGRALSPETAAVWVEAFARHLDARSAILDLGSGAGRYSQLLAEAFDAEVVGVEPAERMREVAAREHAHPRVRYLAGRAEAIPLPNASCDVALLSDVAHHIDDREACGRELRRVLRPGGRVILRGILPASLPSVPFLDYFPSARPLAERQSAALVDLLEALERGGFKRIAHDHVPHQAAADLRAYAERIGLRAISTLELIDDDEFEAGMERLREAAAAETALAPVVNQVDLVVLRRA